MKFIVMQNYFIVLSSSMEYVSGLGSILNRQATMCNSFISPGLICKGVSRELITGIKEGVMC